MPARRSFLSRVWPLVAAVGLHAPLLSLAHTATSEPEEQAVEWTVETFVEPPARSSADVSPARGTTTPENVHVRSSSSRPPSAPASPSDVLGADDATTDLDFGLLGDASSNALRFGHAKSRAAEVTRGARVDVGPRPERAPALLGRAPDCTDLFARTSAPEGAVVVVSVDESGEAHLNRIVDERADASVIAASARCVARLAFVPARDASGHARASVATLRIHVDRS